MFELELTGMASNGQALGRFQGKVYFVPYAIPGERVEVEAELEKPNWGRARLVGLLEPSAHRRDPMCPHFGPRGCGGCHWQHMDIAGQREWKSAIVRDQFRRLAKLPDTPVLPCLAAGPPYEYRNHVQLRSHPDGFGFVSADGLRIVPVKACPVLPPLLGAILGDLDIQPSGINRLLLRGGLRTGRTLVALETSERFTWDPGSWQARTSSLVLFKDKGRIEILQGPGHFTERAAGHSFRISPASFFQVNTAGADVLVKTAGDLLKPGYGEDLIDLYGGVGLFSIALAPKFKELILIESQTSAVEDARNNIEAAGHTHIRLMPGDAGETLKSLSTGVKNILLDPPRRGCGPEVVDLIAALKPARIVYVSCDPATLARDSRSFYQRGYFPHSVQPVDLFPQTRHIETVSLFLPIRGGSC